MISRRLRATYGILRTPGLAIDERVASGGRVRAVEERQQLTMAQSRGYDA